MSGEYKTTNTFSEQVQAFIPFPLPPDPPLKIDGELLDALESASLALGRLDGIARMLPNKNLFLYAYVRKEAVLSSQIEGTQSSLSDLLRFELNSGVVASDDITETSRYVAAFEYGLDRLKTLPLSNRLIREIHGVLLSSGRGSDKTPGEFRRTQNWIGGSRPGTAIFVPPPPYAMENSMNELELFLHGKNEGMPSLIRVGLTHVQFESIHPFLDGNGRLGRLLITFQLCKYGILKDPLLYLSLYFKQNRHMYYDLLTRVRETGDWEEWLSFFFKGISATADEAVETTHRLMNLFETDRTLIERSGNPNSVLRVHEAFKSKPILSLSEVCERANLTFPTVSTAVELLTKQGVTREITGKQSKRIFAYHKYISILNEGTEIVRS